MLSPRTILTSFYQAGLNTCDHDGIEHAGYLAFVGLLALFPFLVFVAALAGFMAEGKAGAEFIQLVLRQLPPDMVQGLTPRINEITSGAPHALLTVSVLGAIWTSSSALEGYRTVLNRAYRVSTPPAYIWRRLLSIAQILIFSFVLVLAMIVVVVLPVASGKVVEAASKSGVPIKGHLIVSISIAVIFLGISLAYYFLPNLKQSIHAVVWGAALVTLLWIATARLLSFYLSRINPTNLVYGSLGSVIAALLFFYVGNVLFIYGAEFNYLLRVALGEKIEPKQDVPEELEEF
jgi:membrane protein